MDAGRFITFEGGEGAGKSTQIRLLAARLKNLGHEVVLTREPGGSAGAEDIRALLVIGEPDRWTALTEVMLHFAARSDHIARTIKPALAQGAWVLCDRFVDSTMAYQGYAQELGRPAIEELTKLVVGPTLPDLTFIFDLPVEVGLSRARARGEGEDRYEKMGPAFHETLRGAFLDIAARDSGRCKVINAALSIEEIAEMTSAMTWAHFDL